MKIEDVNSGDEKIFKILGESETDLDRVSSLYLSLLARALIGHKRVEVVDVQLPDRGKTYKIVEVVLREDFSD